MTRLDNSIDIAAPRDKVFQYVADVTARSEWAKWVKRAEVTSLEREGVGATDAMTMQFGPTKEKVEAIVTEYKKDQVITRRHTRGMEATDRVAVVTVPEGTKVAWSFEYTPPMGAMGKLIDMAFMVRLMEQLMDDSLQILKERLESGR